METKKDKGSVLNEMDYCYCIHPGDILKEELKERKIKQKDFAAAIGMEATHLSALIHGKRNITPAIASRLQEALAIPASVWLNLQNRYDVDKIRLSQKESAPLLPGYLSFPQNEESRLLAESEGANYGDRKRITLLLGGKDIALLTALAARMGWLIEDEPGRTY